MKNRLAILKKKLRRKKCDAILIGQPENRRYLSGYTARDHSISESSGLLLIRKQGAPFLLTDSRFYLQGKQECPHFKTILYKKGIFPLLGELLSSLKIQTLAFESDYLLFSQAQKLIELCKNLKIDFVPTASFVERMRLVKEKDEVELLKKSVLLNEKVFSKVFHRIKPGMREIDIALELETTMVQMGAECASFETIVASGPNGALPHAVPSKRKIRLGEPIVIDMGLVLNGMCSDMTRTIVLGKADPFTKNIFSIVRKAQLKAIKALKPGVTCASVDKKARSLIYKKGYGENFGHGLGHGVGLAVHEMPSLNPRSKKKLRQGMVVTVEPGIYIPDWGGVRLENMVVITKTGSSVLNHDETCLNIGFE